MAKKDEEYYSKFSRRALEDLESRLHNEVIRLRDKYQDTKAKYEKELKVFKSKATREIELFTSKMHKEIVAFENKISKELKAIQKQGEDKATEKQQVNDALNKIIYTQGQEPKKAEATPTKQEVKETKPTQEVQKPQEVRANPTQPQAQNQTSQGGFAFNRKPN
ncbi:hypothetical protein [Helicobacter ailurogastricus]|uniref:Uncharacterized protein n=1 Tax=Helicobacter ailurogastricus TaxID=1578720 RepID=A0A0K2X794_9HELI|nr:hypothetical protein [Helicobacter ailurogastricus]CRF40958.1 hypothetical protein HAL011_07340 [Helicobacter ailurogastricus]CRF42367.1 hypothetical protein HAL013_05370 [Helicobacter ailurogastricus]CRF44622.1 hypothetical protein HAL09_12160 [Helicobacter ailurogastricus]